MTAARWLMVPYLLLTLSGCSVAMAMHGNPEPNFEAFEVGSSRKQVEIQLGQPVSSRKLDNGQEEDTYRYQMGNSPNGHRALMNLYIDFGTLFLAELVLTPIELFQGHEENSYIVYNPDGRAVEIKGYKPPEPSQVQKDAMAAQEKYQKRSGEPSNVSPSQTAP